MPQPITRNTLFYGDNLTILREHIADQSVDLVYLDPPFNSNRNYNVLFRTESGAESEAQVQAFVDTWHWNQAAADQYHALLTGENLAVGAMIGALYQFIGPSQMMAYLVMMAARLVELHRVLKSTGSLYLHCDPTASHYLKVVLDTIFGPENFRNEIVWKRTSARSDSHRWNHIHDTLLFYSRSSQFTWNPQFTPYDKSYTDKFYRYVEPDTGRRYDANSLTGEGVRNGSSGDAWRGIDVRSKGVHWKYTIEKLEELDSQGRIAWPKKQGGMPRLKHYLDEMPGVAIQSIISDIPPLGWQTKERLGYPTQKPRALLERIIAASSNPGDVVLDPFCGCGTTIDAAQQLGRTWIGIDITHLSIALMKYRLRDAHGLEAKQDYDVIGEPVDLDSARQLAEDNRYQFQWWALSLIQARPIGGEPGSKQGKKGADQGIDGVITFVDELAKQKRAIVQVKSGKVSSRDIRDLAGTVQAGSAAIGVFITLEPPSTPMITAAAAAGHYYSPGWNRDYPALQILTIEELLAGKRVDMPPTSTTFKTAEQAKPGAGQMTLGLG